MRRCLNVVDPNQQPNRQLHVPVKVVLCTNITYDILNNDDVPVLNQNLQAYKVLHQSLLKDQVGLQIHLLQFAQDRYHNFSHHLLEYRVDEVRKFVTSTEIRLFRRNVEIYP